LGKSSLAHSRERESKLRRMMEGGKGLFLFQLSTLSRTFVEDWRRGWRRRSSPISSLRSSPHLLEQIVLRKLLRFEVK
jgi:hypothetical protein